MIWDILFVAGGIALVIYGANWLIDGSASIAHRLGISDLVIGLTIVAFGTSTPELVVSVLSATQGVGDIAVGNILGSNIVNILLILGLSALIFPLKIQLSSKWKEIPLSFLAVLVIAVLANDVFLDVGHTSGNILSRADGIILLLFLTVFLVYTFEMSRNKTDSESVVKEMPVIKSIFLIALGITGLFFGGKYLVEGAVGTAKTLGMSERVIGLTIVAVGTSVPELVTSILAAMKHKADIAVGNVLGSNILNIFLILGVTSIIHPLEFIKESNFDILVVAASTLVLFTATLIFGANEIRRREGLLFVLFYIAYVTYLVIG